MIINIERGERSQLLLRARRNPALAEALSTLDDQLRPLTEQLELLTESAKSIEPIADQSAVVEQVAAGLAAGQGVTGDVVEQVATAIVRESAMLRANELLDGLATRLANERGRIVASNIDTVVGSLDTQLRALLEASADLADAPADAATAIDLGRVAEYEQLKEATETYRSIRAAQTVVVNHAWGVREREAWRQRQHDVGVLRDPEAVFPEFTDWWAAGVLVSASGRRRVLEPPWPAAAPGTMGEHLAWLLRHPEAEAWVPSFDQFAERAAELRPEPAVEKAPTAPKTIGGDEDEAFLRPKPQKADEYLVAYARMTGSQISPRKDDDE